MNDILDRAASLFDRRFLLQAFLPVLVLGSLAGALLLSALGLMDEALAFWSRIGLPEQTLLIVSSLAAVWFLAGLLASQFRRITQLYEGYPLQYTPALKPIAEALREHHFQTRNAWDSDPLRSDAAFYSYPEGGRSDFLPTMLGNALRSAEYYGRYRYGIPTTFLWPRLFYTAPEHFRRDIEYFRTEYEWLLGVSFTSGVLAVVIGLSQIVLGAPWWVFTLTFGGGCILSLLMYRGAVSAAEEYGAQLRAGVDLYRMRVLEDLGWALPTSLAQERRTWEEVRRFYLRGEPRGSAYVRSVPPREDAKTP